jgi:MSHA biogenesis protein MshQ
MVIYALGLCGSALAFEDIVFPAVVQGYHKSGNANCNSSRSKLTMYNTSKITGTNGDALQYCSINSYYERENATCDNGIGGYELCSITNSDIQGINLAKENNKFKSTNSRIEKECNASSLEVIGNEFNRIQLNGSCSLTLKSQSEYLITSLNLNNGSIIYLPEGDYWLGSLSINSTAQIIPLGNVRIFINSSVNISNDVVINPSNNYEAQIVSYDSLVLNGDVVINANVYVSDDITLNNQAIINGRVMSKTLTMSGSSQINDATVKPNLQCFNDDISQSALSNDWVVSRSSGTFTPAIVSGRMRLTEAKSNQSTASTYQRLFPAADNLVEIQFDHYAYGGNGADGIALVLSDASITPQPGAFGGPLGYGYKPGISGFAGGWLGVGIDEFGNFSGEGGSYNIGQRRQSVAVRGSGVGTSGYRYLHGACNDGTTNTSGNCLSPVVDGNNVSPAHRYKITIDSQSAGLSIVKIERNTGSGFVT